MTTIKDVARLAGVSTATVSRVLSKPELVSEETKSKIYAVIDETGYVANSLARSFRTNKSYSVLVLVPNIANPFFAEIIQGIENIAQQQQYRILLGDTQYKESLESSYAELLMNRQVDGVISLGRSLPHFEVENGKGLEIPIVMGCEFGEDNGPPTVCIDNEKAAYEACEHLIDLGHKNIAMINAPAQSPLSKERLAGYKKALKKHGIKFDADLVVNGDFSMQSGAQLSAELLSQGKNFSALFAANDEMAIGALKTFDEQGKQVPAEISVVGFDDIPFAQFSSPALTTIRQPRKEMGEKLMQLMLLHIAGEEEMPKGRLILPHQLVKRASSREASRIK